MLLQTTSHDTGIVTAQYGRSTWRVRKARDLTVTTEANLLTPYFFENGLQQKTTDVSDVNVNLQEDTTTLSTVTHVKSEEQVIKEHINTQTTTTSDNVKNWRKLFTSDAEMDLTSDNVKKDKAASEQKEIELAVAAIEAVHKKSAQQTQTGVCSNGFRSDVGNRSTEKPTEYQKKLQLAAKVAALAIIKLFNTKARKMHEENNYGYGGHGYYVPINNIFQQAFWSIFNVQKENGNGTEYPFDVKKVNPLALAYGFPTFDKDGKITGYDKSLIQSPNQGCYDLLEWCNFILENDPTCKGYFIEDKSSAGFYIWVLNIPNQDIEAKAYELTEPLPALTLGQCLPNSDK